MTLKDNITKYLPINSTDCTWKRQKCSINETNGL